MWRKKYLWFNLTHVCRRWRAVVFASASRLDLTITLGPQGPDDIEKTLPGPLQILVNYRCKDVPVTDSALRRLRSALEHRDRVREIYSCGPTVWFDVFFEATKCSFPVLESLSLPNRDLELKVPDVFLGPDLSNLRLLRSLTLYDVSLASISRFLSFSTSLTDLDLRVYFGLSPSEGISLLAILQRIALPMQSHSFPYDHIIQFYRLITVFNPQAHCHPLKINKFLLRWQQCILGCPRGRAFSPISAESRLSFS